LDELRAGYFLVAAALDQVGTVTAGSRHPLPARADRCWADALTLVDEAERALSAGIGELRRTPDAGPRPTIGDLAAALTTAHAEVDSVAAQVGRLRERVDQARVRLLHTEPVGSAARAAAARWELAAAHLDRLIVRLDHGTAALSAYTMGLSGVGSGHADRLAGLLPRTRPPAGEILAGAVAAGRLVFQVYPDLYALPVPAARETPWARRLWSAALRLVRHPPGAAERDASILAEHVLTVRLLARGDLLGYQRCLHRLDRQERLDTYADFLAAGFLLAVGRRFRPGRDDTSVARFVAVVRDHYALPAETDALGVALIRAALGEPHAPIPGSAQVVTVESVLLLGLLAEEDLTRAELDQFLTDTGRLCGEIRADP
jgi:hypothetical protein